MIRKKAAKFEVKDGELYYKQKQNGKVILVDLCVHLFSENIYMYIARLVLV